MHRRRFLTGISTGGIATVAGCLGLRSQVEEPRPSISVSGEGFIVDDGVESIPQRLRGVNLGMAKPGHFPGEAAITRAEYDRWLGLIGEMGANAVRVYTIHPPAFYEALAAYNAGADDPLYLMHGTWIDEAQLLEAGDAFDMAERFEDDLRDTVDVIHGATTLPERPGHASGTYSADISRFTLGFIAGIEWHPTIVLDTNERHQTGGYEGTYLSSTAERPFERWLAQSLDTFIEHEVSTYDTQRPIAFTNWVTTDPLDQPYEPFHLENAATVDPDALVPTERFDAGTFAAYHVYPYYPDFLNETPGYVSYIDHRGQENSYAGYLDDLASVTDVPLLIAEFGVPSSRGIAHRHVHGRHQGGHTEVEQGAIITAMYEDITNADTIGGLVFSWQDEWFKRTWNIQQLSIQHRRPRWSNVQSPEQRFGLVSFDPSSAILLDGSPEGWEDTPRAMPVSPPRDLNVEPTGLWSIKSLDISSDEAYLYLRIERGEDAPTLEWSDLAYMVVIGLSGHGNETTPFNTQATCPPTDFVVRLHGPGRSHVMVDAYYDAFAYLYGEEADLDLDEYRTSDSGRFKPIRMAINRGYTVPATGAEVPFEAVETGRLRFGTTDPEHTDFDSIADVYATDTAIEMRLPWLLLNVADPSDRRRLGEFWKDGLHAFAQFDSIEIAVASYLPDAAGDATPIPGETNLIHAVPDLESGTLSTVSYTPPTWDSPAYRERLKASYDIVKQHFHTHG